MSATGALTLLAASVICGEAQIKTYPFSDPDPVPATAEKRYPYFRYDGSSLQGETRSWKTVRLVSDRLELVFLPEIGGKLWGARDLKTGRDFIYRNDVVKFRNVAMCGPWSAGGIEFNFGIIGHSPTTSSPVRWAVRTNDDASVSYFCGDTEKICGTTWQVEVRLADGEDSFEMRTLWQNASGLPMPYYHWKNAAFSVRSDPELVFPGCHQVGHDGDAHPWPRDEKGRNLASYADNAFGHNKSYHVVDGDPRFFGVWWRGLGIGAWHRSEFGETYGRKAWIWALSREGGIWEDLLTDGAGQYMELQAGRGFNQPRRDTYRTPFKHPTFQPGRTDAFSERWGVARTHEELERLKGDAPMPRRPVVAPADFNWDSAYGKFVRGEQALRERDDRTAEASLAACLAAEPCFVPALVLSAEMATRRGDYGKVRELSSRALSVDAYDAGANYLDGLAAAAQGDAATALERFGLAAFGADYRLPARTEMLRLHVAAGDGALATNCARRILQEDPCSIAALRYLSPDRLAAVWPTFAETEDEPILRGLSKAHASRDVAALRELEREPIAFVFPYRRDQVAPLDWAVRESGSWKFRYLRAVLAAAFGDNERTVTLLDRCDAADEAVVFQFRARFRKGDAAMRDLKRARALGDTWRIGRDLADRLSAADDWRAARAVLEDYLVKYPRCNPLEIRLAKALLELGDHRACLGFLKGVTILPSEFGDNATDIWQAAQKALGEKPTWPEALGLGKPYDEEQ